MQDQLTSLKEGVINRVLLLSLFLLAPVFGLLVYYDLGKNVSWQLIYASILYLTIIFINILHSKLPYAFKVLSVVVVYLHVAFFALNNLLIAGSLIYVILAMSILSLLIERKFTLLVMMLCLLAIAGFAVGLINGVVKPKHDVTLFVTTPFFWVAQLLALCSLLLVFLFGYGNVFSKLNRSIQEQDENKTKYQQVFEKANDAICLLKDGKFLDVNPAACKLFKYSREEFIGKSIADISVPIQPDGEESGQKALRFVMETMHGGSPSFEWKHVDSEGREMDISISLNKVELFNDVYIQGILRDITEKKQKDKELTQYREQLESMVQEKTQDLENTIEKWKNTSEELSQALEDLKETQSQLLHADKMASLGTLTAGVSHEINNPLQYLSGTYFGLLNYFKEHGSADPETTELLLESTETAINRIAEIVKSLNNFSRDNASFDEECDVHTIIKDSLTVLNSQLKDKVTLDIKFDASNSLVIGNVGKLHQVFINIIMNAYQSIENTGTISISTSVHEKELVVQIEDTGCGIDAENLSKITNPFFTTKDPGVGTGLGLSITYSIIADHQGSLDIESVIGKGTNVIITLPLKP